MSSTVFNSGNQENHSRQFYFGYFNDLCSQFAKHVAPKYYHERPERSLQMRLYTLQKGQYLLIFIMFMCLFFISLLMGMAGPRLVVEHSELGSSLAEKNNISSGPFVWVTPKLTTYRKELWMSAKVSLKDSQAETIAKEVQLCVGIVGILQKDDYVTVVSNLCNKRVIICKNNNCDSLILLHIVTLDYSRYILNATFQGLDSLDKHYKINDIAFQLTTYNPDFTQMELFFRLFFVISAIIVTLLYFYAMRQFPFRDWAYEQKFVATLLPLLIAFNNPFYSFTVLMRGSVTLIVDSFFQCSFIYSLLAFWLCVFHGLRQTERSICNFYFSKIVLVGALWLTSLTIAIIEETKITQDPTFSFELPSAHYYNFQLIFMTLLTLFSVYLGYLCLRAFGELRSMNYLDARLKFHASSMSLSAFLAISIVFSRFGYNLFLDNFVVRIYTSYESEGQFLAFYTILNSYIFVLAFVYAPTHTQVSNSHLLKDNPSFSMINESDEEEAEAMLNEKKDKDLRKPLVLGHDDSD